MPVLPQPDPGTSPPHPVRVQSLPPAAHQAVGAAFEGGLVPMMPLRFLGKTSLALAEPVSLAGTPVLSAHGLLRDTLVRRIGAAGAELFAD